jgi:hypothetical protein
MTTTRGVRKRLLIQTLTKVSVTQLWCSDANWYLVTDFPWRVSRFDLRKDNVEFVVAKVALWLVLSECFAFLFLPSPRRYSSG